MIKHSIKIEKTAYYYSIGELNKETNEIWIVCHGYGQLAKYFIKKFECVEKQNRFIIAPEGFNKFYINGYSGRVGANWMTKEQRLDEIDDYCLYLEKLTDLIRPQAHPKCKIKIIGFSQGTATVSRWILKTKHKIETLILWGGKIAFDFNFSLFKQKHSETKNYVVFGTKDEFYSQEDIQTYRKELNDFKTEWISYSGGHAIDTKTLKLLEN
ncbi:MAG: phospholipase [Bacteroidetes bacterium MED-G21]|nr:MAG: phospholipase [Bacteroidetes bacterium MED-G21]